MEPGNRSGEPTNKIIEKIIEVKNEVAYLAGSNNFIYLLYCLFNFNNRDIFLLTL